MAVTKTDLGYHIRVTRTPEFFAWALRVLPDPRKMGEIAWPIRMGCWNADGHMYAMPLIQQTCRTGVGLTGEGDEKDSHLHKLSDGEVMDLLFVDPSQAVVAHLQFGYKPPKVYK
jgi:hypothetical protein